MMIYQPDNQTNSSQPLRFISQAVIERLRSGNFVPKRKLNEEAETSERRRNLSPLAICKRCIGYQPLVFKDRQPLLWQLVEGLNSAYTQLILVTGEPGSGKTSLLRGVAELMGGGIEQLIWFEISAYSSAASLCETILRQLVCLLESNPEVGSLPLKESIAPAKEDPIKLQSSYDREKTFQRLEPLMANSKNAPIFLVLDDIDPFVSSQERLEAPVLKETFNFLLSQSNIKIAIASKKQPYADLKAPPQSILELHLGNFDAQTIQQITDRTTPKLENNQTLEVLFSTLLKASQGKPWVVQLLCQLAKKSAESLPLLELDYQKRLATASKQLPNQVLNETCPVLIEALAHWLLQWPQTQEERLILMVLSFIRHPIDEQVLKFLLPHSLPTFLQFSKKSTIKPFLRKQAEPQTVFNFLEAQWGKQKGVVSSQSILQNTILFELFPAIRQGILQHLSVQDKLSWHEQLDKFYNDQSLLFPQQRVFSNSDTLTLSREARFHRDKALDLSKQLQAGLNTSPQAGYTTPILNNLPTAFTQSGKPILTPEEEASTTSTMEGGQKKSLASKKPVLNQKPKDAKEIELLEKITQAKQENKADTYFSTLLKLVDYRLAQACFTEAEQTLKTLETSLDDSALSKKLTANQLAIFQATTLQKQGELALHLDQPAKAMKFFQAALNQWENIISSTPEKSRETQATCHYYLMNILVKLNQETLALNHAEAIFRLFPIQQKTLMAGTTEAVQQKVARFQAESLVLQASHRWQFQQGKALEAYKQAYHLFLSIHASAEASQQLAAMGKLFWEKSDLTKTRHCFMRALQLDATHTQWEITCQNQLDFALLAWEEGYPQEALTTLEQLLVLSQKQKLPLWQIKTFLAMANIVADQPGTLMQQKMYLQKAHQLGKPLLSAKGLKSVEDRLDGISGQLHQSVEGISINPI
ncbi:MAG: ATP-binding protein [Vampirovibrio sp.]|nr:ATP-binding protein [Vampirovibrio sp.]